MRRAAAVRASRRQAATVPRALGAAIVMALWGATAGVAAQETPESFLAEITGHFESSSAKFVALAEAMPASTYDWSPGEGVATVAGVFMHVARYNYMYLHENMGRETPVPPAEYRRWEEDVTSKDEALEILRASFEYVEVFLADMTGEDIARQTRLYGRTLGEGAVLLQLVAHMNEHLGQSIAYARMNGVVPPWSM